MTLILEGVCTAKLTHRKIFNARVLPHEGFGVVQRRGAASTLLPTTEFTCRPTAVAGAASADDSAGGFS
jgi:hypothetical protein